MRKAPSFTFFCSSFRKRIEKKGSSERKGNLVLITCRKDVLVYFFAGSKLQRCDSNNRYMESRSSEFLRAACFAIPIIFSTFRGTLISLVRKSNSAEKSTLTAFSAVDFRAEKNLKDFLRDMNGYLPETDAGYPGPRISNRILGFNAYS